MNVGFFVDKSQTVQSILGLIRESKNRDHSCSVYSTCDIESLVNMPQAGIDLDNVTWYSLKNRNEICDIIQKDHSNYDALIGINLFNRIWRSIYESDNSSKFYSVEYCWNEIYNGRKDYSGKSILFANSEWSKDAIEKLTGYDRVEFKGSPWFEIVREFRELEECKERIVTFMAPHNSFVNNYSGFIERVRLFLPKLREFCDNHDFKLVLKTRSKYSYPYHEIINFDGVVTDDNIVAHLRLYAISKCVFNFSSSAINELSFLEVPYVCLFSDLHANLHKNRENLFKAMSVINDQYYSGSIFDGIHCDMIPAGNLDNADKFLNTIDDEFEKVDKMIKSNNRDWSKFQKNYFPGDHDNASSNILDFIERECLINR